MSALGPRVDAWNALGADAEIGGRRIRYWSREASGRTAAAGPLLVFLHGFPSSSFDWRHLWEMTDGRAALAFDCLGFGLSEKPPGADYSLILQADRAEHLIAGREAYLIAHDMGTTIANELMARDIEGKLGFDLAGVMLFNGSMIQSAASPILGQRLLRGRFGAQVSRLSSPWFFRKQFGSIFSPEHPLSSEEAADQWALLSHEDGQRIGHELIAYMDERELRADRWHGAIRDWPGRLQLGWAMRDPVATAAVLNGILALRPDVPLQRWEELGHYPQLESPETVFGTLSAALPGS